MYTGFVCFRLYINGRVLWRRKYIVLFDKFLDKLSDCFLLQLRLCSMGVPNWWTPCVNLRGGHAVWNYVVDTLCECTWWTRCVILRGGHAVWSYVVDTLCDPMWWTPCVNLRGGHPVWSYVVDTLCDPTWWTHCVILRGGHAVWSYVVDTLCEPTWWTHCVTWDKTEHCQFRFSWRQTRRSD